METIGARVKFIISYQNTTMTEFARELNISQSMVSKICSGKAKPSERTVSDICRIYNVNKQWLLYGEGEMVDYPALEEEIREIFSKVHPDNATPDITERVIKALVRLPPALYPELIQIFEEWTANYEKRNPSETRSYEEGFRQGMKMAKYYSRLKEDSNGDD